jgi:hypothetical protein
VIRQNARDARGLAAEAARVFETTRDMLPVATAYVSAGAWDPRGGLSQDVVEETQKFFVGTGSLPEGHPSGALVDRSYLDRVLSELERGERGGPPEP